MVKEGVAEELRRRNFIYTDVTLFEWSQQVNIEKAIRDTEKDLKNGRYSTNLEEHFREIDSV